MTPPLPAPLLSAPLLLTVIFCTATSITVGVFCLVASVRAQWRSHLPRFRTLTEPHGPFRLVFFHAERCQRETSSGCSITGQGRNGPRPCVVCVLAAVERNLLRAMVSTPSVPWTLREKALTWCMKYPAPAWVVRATTRAQRDPCAPTLRDWSCPKRICH